ncbi:Shikimate dehydrogenase (NADP(+)) [Austwickia sp. TVS 96-490-7B]|nr:Shikimate dehydrogenase (NADP(+)) [Austwickia sp. TVS 96-490-7B]
MIGSPIGHSASPVLHRAAYAALGLTEWRYDAIAVGGAGEPSVEEFVSGLGPQWVGLSVTMPGKEAAAVLANSCSAGVTLTGAANTLIRHVDGWYADNTDIVGLVEAVRSVLGGERPLQGRDVLLLGSGATARAACVAVSRLGAEGVCLAVRGRARAQTVELVERLGLSCHQRSVSDLTTYAVDFPVMISTLPTGTDLGLGTQGALAPGSVVMDVGYGHWPTPVARWAGSHGALVVPGTEMLLHQAVEQVALMTGMRPPTGVMRSALESATGVSSPQSQSVAVDLIHDDRGPTA